MCNFLNVFIFGVLFNFVSICFDNGFYECLNSSPSTHFIFTQFFQLGGEVTLVANFDPNNCARFWNDDGVLVTRQGAAGPTASPGGTTASPGPGPSPSSSANMLVFSAVFVLFAALLSFM